MTASLFAAVCFASAILEALWAVSVILVSRRNIIAAVLLAGLMPLVSSQLTIVYVHDRLACIPFAIGSMIGMAVTLLCTRDKRPTLTQSDRGFVPARPTVEPTKPNWWSRGGHA